MKAIRIERFGGPEVMQLRDVEVPEPKTGEVLVKNFFVGINPVDYKIRQGQYPEVKQDKLPLTLGREVAGVVEKVGQGVSDFKPGDRVFAMIGADGGYAEYARVPAAHLARIPAALDWPVAAGVPLAGHTAWQALVEHGHIEQGQKVLIHGGTGGVGHFAVQFAKVKGAQVYATASTDSLAFLRELGVDRAQLSIELDANQSTLPLTDLIDDVEAALGTAVQTAVKRADEQAFALANGQNLMFCEDAARRLNLATSRVHAGQAYGAENHRHGQLLADRKRHV